MLTWFKETSPTRESPLETLKSALWREAQNYPLFHLLQVRRQENISDLTFPFQDAAFYIFVSITQVKLGLFLCRLFEREIFAHCPTHKLETEIVINGTSISNIKCGGNLQAHFIYQLFQLSLTKLVGSSIYQHLKRDEEILV